MTSLVKLTLKNFKSFKKAEIPIGKGFTSIVGSNGSGKSNVLDALLFVLGITSLKTLRAGKLTDLVNNNCKENYAKVDLTLKDKNEIYEISRMIDKQGKSVYRLNEKRTTLNEINSLLVDLGIDISGHNIVTQGDITKVVNMSSMERRAIIDTVAGLSEFDEKKNEAIKELNKVESRIKEALIILNERNNFLEDIEKEMNSAKEYVALEKERKQIKSTIISKELYSIEKRINELDFEKKTVEKQKEEIEANIENLRKELVEAKQKTKDLGTIAMKGSEDIYNKIGKAYESKKGLLALEKDRIETKEKEVEKDKDRVKTNNEVFDKSKKEKKEIEEKLKILEEKVKLIDKELKEISSKKEDLEKIVSEKNVELKRIENELDQKNKSIDDLRKELFDLEVFEKQWNKQKAYNEKQLSELTSEKEKLNNKKDELNSKKNEIERLGGKEISKKLIEKENEIEENNNLLSTLNAINKQEEKATKELEKEISKCPVCDASIDKDKKAHLLEQKTKSIIENDHEITKIVEKLRELKQELSSLKEKETTIQKLGIEITQISDIEQKLIEINEKIKVTNQELDQKSFEAQLSKKHSYDEKLKELLTARESTRENLKRLREENIFEEFTKISGKQELLIHNNSSIVSEISELKMQLNSISSKEESILIENAELENEIKQNTKEINEKKPIVTQMEQEINNKEDELKNAKKENENVIKEKEILDKKIDKIDLEISVDSGKAKRANDRLNEFNIESSKLEVKQSDLEEEAKQFEDIEKLGGKTIDELKSRNIEVEKRLDDIGAVNLKAVDNFNELKKEVDEITQKSEKLDEERMAVLDMIDKIDVKRTNVFMECFNEINHNFSDMFAKFFNGEGLLDLTNPDNPLESGLIIDAQPKGGKLQNIDSMSGGEKTLTALAFMFAIQLYSPAPFYAFDEADAALDKENSLKMGNLIAKIAEKSQFIAITHNDTITKKANQIVGVALNKEHSSVIGLKLKNNLAS